MEGRLSRYHEKLAIFESGDLNGRSCLLFIGGLTAGFLDSPYLPSLSKRLEALGWSTAQILLSSSYNQFGLSSLAKDAEEIEKAVEYLRNVRGKTKVVLMGNSTGCQDAMYYLTGPPISSTRPEAHGERSIRRARVDGAILQAPVSDREMFEMGIEQQPADSPLSVEAKKWLAIATDLVKSGKGDEWLPKEASSCLPLSPPPPLTAYRFWSLWSEGGDDDFFTSTLPQSSLSFHQSPVPLLVLISGADEFYPPHLLNNQATQQDLLDRWKAGSQGRISELSCVLAGASHEVTEAECLEPLAKVVEAFLSQPTPPSSLFVSVRHGMENRAGPTCLLGIIQ